MERTLDTVLRSISTQPGANATHTEAQPDHSAPRGKTAATQALIASPPPLPSASTSYNVQRSPKLHSLPDNALNPLGLLAEASLTNRKVIRANGGTAPVGVTTNPSAQQRLGVANDGYFKPGE